MRGVGWGLALAGLAVVAAGAQTAAVPVAHLAQDATLTQRERALQFLNRFTFGPRPGEVERVMAMGPEAWLARQLEPQTIPDGVLEKRLTDYPTLTMTPEQVLTVFPDYGAVVRVADGRTPYPTDPLLRSEYQVQVYKLRLERERGAHPAKDLTDDERAAKRKLEEARATRLVRGLLALPKRQRMAAIDAMAPADRIAIASDDVQGGLRDELFAGFTARERETAYSFQGWVGDAYCAFDELAQSRELRQVLSERQLLEVMTDFWFNHFNVYQPGGADEWYTTAFERDAIRAHALGKFRDLLLATAQSPAMLVYLDNWVSSGPHSAGDGIDPEDPDGEPMQKGLNENYGREVMELHTVGTKGGYTQADVIQLSAILTGWTVEHPRQGGGFHFEAMDHEPGTKRWFGYTIDDDGRILAGPAVNPVVARVIAEAKVPAGMKQGYAALALLAGSPQAAHFLSYEMAQRFVADEPPAALVDRMAATYLATDGDIKEVLRTLAASPEFNSRDYFRNKVKTPTEFVASVFRATGSDVMSAGPVVSLLSDQMGEAPYKKLDPTGYYSTADHWMNTQALQARLNFADDFTHGRFANQTFDAGRLLTMGSRAPVGSAVRPEFALKVLEGTLVGGEASPATHAFIRDQLARDGAGSRVERLDLMTALVIGSPDFQVR